MSDEPLAPVSAPPAEFPLSAETVRTVIARIRDSTGSIQQEIADFIEVLIATGIRPVQAAQLIRDHLHIPGRLLVPTGKLMPVVCMNLDNDAAQLLTRIWKSRSRHRGPLVFPNSIHRSANIAIADACTQLGVEKFKCHQLRDFHLAHSGWVYLDPATSGLP